VQAGQLKEVVANLIVARDFGSQGELYAPLVDAAERLLLWLIGHMEGSSMRSKGFDGSFEQLWAGEKVGGWVGSWVAGGEAEPGGWEGDRAGGWAGQLAAGACCTRCTCCRVLKVALVMWSLIGISWEGISACPPSNLTQHWDSICLHICTAIHAHLSFGFCQRAVINTFVQFLASSIKTTSSYAYVHCMITR
jgi:hypothetical protein